MFWAEHPLGYNMHTVQVLASPDMTDVYSSVSLNDSSLLDAWVNSDLNATSEGNSGASAHESYSYNYSAHSTSYAENDSHVSDDLDHAEDEAQASEELDHGEDDAQASDEFDHADDVPLPKPKKNTKPKNTKSKNAKPNTTTLKGIMMTYPKWRLVLAYLRLLMRVAILKGESDNPHVITRASIPAKNAFIAVIFAQSLERANTTSKELETGWKLIHLIYHTDYSPVISSKDGSVIIESEVLYMASVYALYLRYLSHLQ
jgi:hypothetical protein